MNGERDPPRSQPFLGWLACGSVAKVMRHENGPWECSIHACELDTGLPGVLCGITELLLGGRKRKAEEIGLTDLTWHPC